MRIVTVCEQGNNRSVHAAFLMRHRRQVDGGGTNDVIPIGLKTMSKETQVMLFDWAEWIIVTDATLLLFIPSKYEPKIKNWDVGADRWPRPFDRNLMARLKEHMQREFAT